MSLDTASTLTAIVTSAAALVTAAVGWWQQNKRLNDQKRQLIVEQERWQAEFVAEQDRQVVGLEKDFRLEQYRYRLNSYSEVLQALGTVSFVEGTSWEELGDDLVRRRDELRSTADDLFTQLYGKAGLLMTITTRNFVHSARQECLKFLAQKDARPDIADLVDAFYEARRYLRADLELLDDRSPERLNDLAEQIRRDPGVGANTGPMPAIRTT